MAAVAGLAQVFTGIISKSQEMAANEQAGNAKAKSFTRDAEIKERNAEEVLLQAREDSRRLDIMQRRDYGSQVAGYGASGVTMDGSPLDVLRESVASAHSDQQLLMNNAARKATALRSDAGYDRSTADQITKATRYNPWNLLIPGATNAMKAYPAFVSSSGSSSSSSSEEEVDAID